MPPRDAEGNHHGPEEAHPAARALPPGGERARETSDLIEALMGRKPELRFQFIQENAQFARDLDV